MAEAAEAPQGGALSLARMLALLGGPSGSDPNADLIAQALADIAQRARLPRVGGLFGGDYARFMADRAAGSAAAQSIHAMPPRSYGDPLAQLVPSPQTFGPQASGITSDIPTVDPANNFQVAGSVPTRPIGLRPIQLDRARPQGDNTGYWQLGGEWLTGTGPRVHNFGQDDPVTQILRQHSWVQRVRDQIASSKPIIGRPIPEPYSLKGLEGVPEFVSDYAAIPTNGAVGNLAAAYLGSYGLTYTVKHISPDGIATVDFHVSNTSDMRSATHPPIIGYTPAWNNTIGKALNNAFSAGPLSPRKQTFDWTEQIRLKH